MQCDCIDEVLVDNNQRLDAMSRTSLYGHKT